MYAMLVNKYHLTDMVSSDIGRNSPIQQLVMSDEP